MGVSKIDRKRLATLMVGVVLATGLLGTISTAEEYSVGSEDEDWWIDYPDQHPDTGTEVEHPEWILEDLEEGPVLILDHSTNCVPCVEQEEDIDEVLEDLGDDVIYYNLIPTNDEDEDEQKKANELFGIYDPNGGKQFIPLTIVLTLVEDEDGDVRVGWHSIEDATGEDWIRSRLEDAIEYHEENVDDWEE